jgi:NADP-dependent 3-hydroxy acid dehydrogenase YdfG
MASKKEDLVSPLRQSVVITGASKGLGEALARLYANPGRTLGLLGRDRYRLEAVATRCRSQGADVVIAALDVKDGPGLARWFEAFDAKHPVDLLIVNAGMFTGHGKFTPETVEEMTELVGTNLEGAALTIAAVVPMMRARQSGRDSLRRSASRMVGSRSRRRIAHLSRTHQNGASRASRGCATSHGIGGKRRAHHQARA